MREILFRGIWVHGNKEWIEGDLVRDSEGKPHIVDSKYVDYWGGDSIFVCEDECEVIPETVGQYTGLTDKNGKKIFEGDIVESTSDLVNLRGEKSGKKITKFYEVVVTADNSSFTYGTREIGETYISRTIYKESAQRFYRVIGNIHDNPELLEVK